MGIESGYSKVANPIAEWWRVLAGKGKAVATSSTATRVADAVGTGIGGAAGAVSGVLHPLKKPAKWGLIGAGVTAGVATLGIVAANMRSNRRFDPNNAPEPDMGADMPVYDPVAQMPQPNTMMGMQPVEGSMAQRELARRGGMAAGIDASSPNITSPSGVSAIDGKHVQDLDASKAPMGLGA